MKGVVVIGPFPPPVHGMAKNLKIFYEQIKNLEKAYKIDTSPGTIVRGFGYHFTKFAKVLYGVSKLFLLCCVGKIKSVYMPPDAGIGAWYSLLFVIIARAFGIKLVLHHRSFLYINKKTVPISLLVKLQPQNTTHIFLCERMKENFNNLYNNTSEDLIVSNAQYVAPVNEIRNVNETIVLGHLSNLGFEKGLKEVFELTNLLLEKGIKVRLELAGPSENYIVEEFLQNELERLGDSVVYHGPLFNKEKELFYSNLDFFLFPTMYRNEAQPNVLFEAMSFGAPVFSINTGCIAADVNCSNGFIFKDQKSFVAEGAEVLIELSKNTEKINRLKQTTLESIKSASINAKDNYQKLLELVTSS